MSLTRAGFFSNATAVANSTMCNYWNPDDACPAWLRRAIVLGGFLGVILLLCCWGALGVYCKNRGNDPAPSGSVDEELDEIVVESKVKAPAAISMERATNRTALLAGADSKAGVELPRVVNQQSFLQKEGKKSRKIMKNKEKNAGPPSTLRIS